LVRTEKSRRVKNANLLSDSEQVTVFLQELDHPLKAEIEDIRKLILGIGDQVSEHIKWRAPSFCVNNQDRITFNFHVKQGFRLVFHCGSKKTGLENKEPFLVDETGLLEWVAGDRALVHITSSQDFMDKRDKLIAVATNWMDFDIHREDSHA